MKPEEDPLYALSPAQELALEVLLAGKSQTEAADAAGVSRETVNRWFNRHPAFIAAYRQRRHARATAAGEAAANLDRQAIDVVGNAVGKGDIKAAIAWLRTRPKGSEEQSTQATTPEGVIEEMAKAEESKIIRDALSVRGRLQRSGIQTPPTDGIRRLLDSDLRREFDLPPLQDDEAIHWSERDRVPASWLVSGSDEVRAAERLRNHLNTKDGSYVTNVAPIDVADLRMLFEVVQLDRVETLEFQEHPCDGERFHLYGIEPRATQLIGRIANRFFDEIAVRWFDSELSEDLHTARARHHPRCGRGHRRQGASGRASLPRQGAADTKDRTRPRRQSRRRLQRGSLRSDDL